MIGAVGTSSEQRRFVLERFGGRPSVGVITAFAKRGGVGSPDEIAQDLGEPSASPPTPPLTIMAHPALRDPALRAFADLLLAFEDDGADLAVAFRKLDTDRSGAVDARQLRSGLKSLGKTFAHFSMMTRAASSRPWTRITQGIWTWSSCESCEAGQGGARRALHAK